MSTGFKIFSYIIKIIQLKFFWTIYNNKCLSARVYKRLASMLSLRLCTLTIIRINVMHIIIILLENFKV